MEEKIKIGLNEKLFDLPELRGRKGRALARELEKLVSDAVGLINRNPTINKLLSTGNDITLFGLLGGSSEIAKWWLENVDQVERLMPKLLPPEAAKYLEEEGTEGEFLNTFFNGILPFHLQYTFGLPQVAAAVKKFSESLGKMLDGIDLEIEDETTLPKEDRTS